MPFDVVDLSTGNIVKIYWVTTSNIGLPQGLIFTGKNWKFVNLDNYVSMEMYEAILEAENEDNDLNIRGEYEDETEDDSFVNLRCLSIGREDNYVPTDDEDFDIPDDEYYDN